MYSIFVLENPHANPKRILEDNMLRRREMVTAIQVVQETLI